MRTMTPSYVDATADDLERLYAWPNDRPWTRLNFIASMDGSIQGVDGRSGSLSTDADRLVFRMLRSTCDAVLVGAGTARVEGYRPVRPAEVDGDLRARCGLTQVPALAVVSRSLDLPLELVIGAAARTIVLTTAAASPSRRAALGEHADVVVVGDQQVDLLAARSALTARGLSRVVAEGGSVLAHELAAAGVVDELCLTLRATLLGGSGLRFAAGAPLSPPLELELGHVLVDGPDLYLRYRIMRSRE
jgi:5-amino-6-(5-phosphoribosylamino)uracil reductase